MSKKEQVGHKPIWMMLCCGLLCCCFVVQLPGCASTPTTTDDRIKILRRGGIISYQGPFASAPEQQTVDLYHESNTPVTIHSIKFAYDNQAHFRLVNPPTLPFQLQPGVENKRTIIVQYDPLGDASKRKELPVSAGALEAVLRVEFKGLNNTTLRSTDFRQSYTPPPTSSKCSMYGQAQFTFQDGHFTATCDIKNDHASETYDFIKATLHVEVGPKEDFLPLKIESKGTLPAGEQLHFSVSYHPKSGQPPFGRATVVLDMLTKEGRRFQKRYLFKPVVYLIPLQATFPPHNCTSDEQCQAQNKDMKCRPLFYQNAHGCMHLKDETRIIRFFTTKSNTPQTKIFKVHSAKSNPVLIESIQLDTPSSDLLLKTSLPLPATLKPGESMDVSVTLHRQTELTRILSMTGRTMIRDTKQPTRTMTSVQIVATPE
ncbi:MAG: hypothetical protein CL920_34015 [Deltaproteobacteria bacterium]|nr:hypothetical protein [Deltaproteobacteria bacterium]MBU53739.1 hypothetical protein [Deltaproteobacteria bacterium]|tara:strand:+ start:2428 stop:3714 length:1287 start_codon:yes stop_codon:yes gene_type:complete